MIQSAVTVSLVSQARGGPFVFWDDLPAACATAAKLGFDAVEIFAPGPDTVDRAELRQLLDEHQLRLAAVGTGAGMVIHGLNFTSPDESQRQQAVEFVQSMIEFGAEFGAPAIIGSMQGKWGDEFDRNAALDLLRDALNTLAGLAADKNVPLIYEPLNRYETNLVCTIADGVDLMKSLATDNVKLLADLFHMNIEETNLADAIRTGSGHIGHVHLVDSNRRAAGMGHIDYTPIAAALNEINYDGYASAEAFALPNSNAAAEQTIKAFCKYFQQ